MSCFIYVLEVNNRVKKAFDIVEFNYSKTDDFNYKIDNEFDCLIVSSSNMIRLLSLIDLFIQYHIIRKDSDYDLYEVF